MSAVSRFLGDSPFRVVVKLILASFVVGVVMSAFGWYPLDIWFAVRDFFVDLWRMGFSAVDRFVAYILLGAAIVVPLFILLRIASYRKAS